MQELTPKTVLAVAAHADDNEFCFGGTIAKWTANGTEVHYLIITDGRRGTPHADDDEIELIKTRQNEQKAAASILGVASTTYLNYEDGRMEINWNLKRDIVKKIRELKPDTVLCMDPTFLYSTEFSYINHNDHRVVGQATVDAVYPLARDETAFDELNGLPPHKVSNLLMNNFNDENYFVDISHTIDKKIEALKAHASQFGSGDGIEAMVRDVAQKTAGKVADCNLAEGFVRLSILG